MDLNLQDSHFFVTGASGGIGLAISKLLLKEGALVTMQYRTQLETLSKLLKMYPHRAAAVHADVLNEQEVVKSIHNAIESFGLINGIVINHGIWIEKETPLVNMTLDQWNTTLNVDLTGAFLYAREYMRGLHKYCKQEDSNLSMIFIGSTAGKFGEANHSDYASTKSALMYGLTRSLKNEIVQIHPNARVNTVMPGWILTPMAEAALEDESVVQKIQQTMALRKIGKPDDVANAVLFLLSDTMSGHVSGQIIEVCGGMEGRVLHEFKE